MKPLTIIAVIAILSTIAFGALWAFKVVITFIQILIVVILIFIMVFAALGYLIWIKLQQRQPTGSQARKALDFARTWWLDYAHEKIDVREEGRGGLGCLPNSEEKFFGWVFHRLDGDKKGQPLVLIVKANPLDYVWHDGEPGYEDLDDPFYTFFGEYSRSPGPKVAPEAMPGYWKRGKAAPQTVVKVDTGKPKEEEFIKKEEKKE